MRNLFSFLGGLAASVLYALVHGILLLDRLICRFYDLPLWKWLGRSFAAIGRHRIACAIAVFVPCFVLPCSLLLHTGSLVVADGRPLGMVQQPEELSAAVARIEQDASSLQGSEYTIPVEIKSVQTLGTKEAFLSDGELTNALIDATEELDTLAVISIDGQQAGVCRTSADAQTLLDRIKAQYTTSNDDDAAFMQAVNVQSVIAPTELVSDLGELYEDLSPRLDVTATRAVTYTEEIPYETVTRENSEKEQTYHATLQEGAQGEAVVTAEIMTIDGQEHGRTVLERTVLSEATNEIVEIGTKNIGIGTGDFSLPIHDYTFTSAFKWRWGRLHSGVDLAAPEGTPVYAADNGKVIVSEESGNGYGRYVIIDHGNGYKTLYGHNSSLLVSVGDIVAKGDKITLSGNTGNSTGPHLHFEVIVGDEKVDPQGYLSF